MDNVLEMMEYWKRRIEQESVRAFGHKEMKILINVKETTRKAMVESVPVGDRMYAQIGKSMEVMCSCYDGASDALRALYDFWRTHMSVVQQETVEYLFDLFVREFEVMYFG